jgi:hypothetical protein
MSPRSSVRAAALLAGLLCTAAGARADEPVSARAAPSAVLLDRVVARWSAPETGGALRPQFIFERELAFETRLATLAESEPEPGVYPDRHERAALDRHIAETLLASLPVQPEPTPREIAARMEAARAILEQRVRGRARLLAAAAAEGITSDEIEALLRREAKASLYLDRMVAPMLEPSPVELRALHQSGATPFKDEEFEKVQPALVRWYIGRKLSQAIEAFYLNARARVLLVMIKKAR